MRTRSAITAALVAILFLPLLQGRDEDRTPGAAAARDLLPGLVIYGSVITLAPEEGIQRDARVAPNAERQSFTPGSLHRLRLRTGHSGCCERAAGEVPWGRPETERR